MPVCEECILFGEYPWTYHGIKDERVHYCKEHPKHVCVSLSMLMR